MATVMHTCKQAVLKLQYRSRTVTLTYVNTKAPRIAVGLCGVQNYAQNIPTKPYKPRKSYKPYKPCMPDFKEYRSMGSRCNFVSSSPRTAFVLGTEGLWDQSPFVLNLQNF